MEITSIINLVLVFAMVLTALAAMHNGRPWIATSAVFAGGLNLSQFVLQQG